MGAWSKNSAVSAPRGLFQILLDRLATRGSTGSAAPPAAERLEPRLASYLAQITPRCVAPNSAAYEEDDKPPPELQTTRQDSASDSATEPPLAARAAALREKILTARSRDDVKRLRRLGARLLHPDLSPAHERADAEKIMAELNAAIDAALRARRPSP